MQCRLCGKSNLKLYYVQGNNDQFKFYKCRNCKLVNYDILNGSSQKKYFSDKYADPYDESKKTNIDQKLAYRYIKKRITGRGKLLDIGCGNGRLLLEAKSDNWEVKGIELSEFLATSIKNNFNIDVLVLDFLNFKPMNNEIYDLIIMRHVLEHLTDSILALTKIHSLLSKNGYIIFEFPDIEGFDLKIKRFLNKIKIHKKKYSPEYIPGHCNEFSKKSFKYLLKKTGFELIEWSHYSSKSKFNLIYKYLFLGSKVRTLIKKK